MFQRYQHSCVAFVGLLVLCAAPALAVQIDTANATVTCNSYELHVSASALVPGTKYLIDYTIDISPSPGGSPITLVLPFTASSTTYSGSVWGPFPTLGGTLSFTGTARLAGANTVGINFSPTSMTCGTPPTPSNAAQSTITSNFNGTSLDPGDWVWFNANFTVKGVPSTGATITFTNSAISFAGTQLLSSVPNAQITFSPSATCSSTTFDAMTNTWITTVPVSGDDEILLSGLAVPVPATGTLGGPDVSWTGNFNSSGVSGLSLQWKWGAAVYTSFSTDYNSLAVKAGHQTACGKPNGDHAGTPEGVNNSDQPWKQFVTGGARGGGGSNWTGSWSGTQSVSPVPVPSGPVVGPKG